MAWNYRIINHGDWFGLHEAYYGEDGKPNGYTTDAISFVCDEDEGAAGIIASLEMALADARKHPVMKPDEFPPYEAKEPNP